MVYKPTLWHTNSDFYGIRTPSVTPFFFDVCPNLIQECGLEKVVEAAVVVKHDANSQILSSSNGPSQGATRGAQRETLSPNTLRAKGTLISGPPIFYPLRDAILPTRERENGLFNEKPSTKAIFPFSRGKNRISRGVENRGSLISVPLALRVLLGGKSKWGALKCGLQVSLANSCTIVCNCAHLRPSGPFCKGNFCRKMTTLVGNRGQVRTTALSPRLKAPI